MEKEGGEYYTIYIKSLDDKKLKERVQKESNIK